MSIIYGIYNTNTYPVTTKQTYIDKYDKSLKLPFFSALQNNLVNSKSNREDENPVNINEISISDNVELSSAVTGATATADSDISDTVK